MKTSRRAVITNSFSVCIVSALLTASAALASEHAEVTAAWGALDYTTWSGSAHSPGCWTAWSHDVQDGPAFAEVVQGWNPPYCGTFTVRCAGDTLACRGAWDEVNPSFAFHYLHYVAELGCTLQVTAPVHLILSRELPIPLDAEGHRVEHTDPDGEVTTYLGDDPADLVELDLAAGIHTLRVLVDVYYSDSDNQDVQPPYDGTVTATWTDSGTSADARSWGAVKTGFR